MLKLHQTRWIFLPLGGLVTFERVCHCLAIVRNILQSLFPFVSRLLAGNRGVIVCRANVDQLRVCTYVPVSLAMIWDEKNVLPSRVQYRLCHCSELSAQFSPLL